MLHRPFVAMACCFLLGILAAADTGISVWGYLFTAAALFALYDRMKAVWSRGGRKKTAAIRGRQWEDTHRRKRQMIGRVLLCALLFLAGYRRYESEQNLRAVYLSDIKDGMQLSVQGTIAAKQFKNNQYIYELESCMIGSGQIKRSKNESVLCNRIYVYSDSDEVSIGEILVLDGTVELWSSAVNEGNFDAQSYYYTRKVDFKLKDITIRGRYGSPCVWKEKLWQFKQSLKEVYRMHLGEEECGILLTMVLGDKEQLLTETKRRYQIAGLLHITAISGLHISVIGMTLYRVLRRFGMGFTAAAVCAGTIMYGYGVMVGMGTSVQRAIIMFLLLLTAAAVGRSYDTLNALGAAAIFLLWDNPYLLWDAGFALSFTAILGVAWVGKSKTFGKSRLEKIGEKIYIHTAIQLTTLPIVAWYYYEIPSYALFMNLLILPCIGILLGLGIAGGLSGLAIKQAAAVLLFPCQKMLMLCNWLCGICAKLPGAVQIIGRPKMGQIVCYYLLLGMITVWGHRKNGAAKIEGVNREKKNGMGVLQISDDLQLSEMCRLYVRKIACWLLGVTILAAIVCIPVHQEFELAVLDVGQGDASFLRTASGYHIFVDGGSTDVKRVGEYRILPFLKYKGAGQIDCWIVSHTDEDHISGLKEVLALGYDVRRLVCSETIIRDASFQELEELAGQAGTDIVYLKAGDCIHLGDAVIRSVYPLSETVNAADKNASSLVVQYEDGNFSGIFTGDIGIAEERELLSALGKVDFYKAAHHGSKYSNSKEFLQVLHPTIATVSCSAANRYGHPGREAIAHMEAVGCAIYYTMESGQITIKCNEDKVWVEEYNERGEG